MKLDHVGARLRANDLEHLVLIVDQHQGAVLSGPDTQLLHHCCPPLSLRARGTISQLTCVSKQLLGEGGKGGGGGGGRPVDGRRHGISPPSCRHVQVRSTLGYRCGRRLTMPCSRGWRDR